MTLQWSVSLLSLSLCVCRFLSVCFYSCTHPLKPFSVTAVTKSTGGLRQCCRIHQVFGICQKGNKYIAHLAWVTKQQRTLRHKSVSELYVFWLLNQVCRQEYCFLKRDSCEGQSQMLVDIQFSIDILWYIMYTYVYDIHPYVHTYIFMCVSFRIWLSWILIDDFLLCVR